MRWLARSRLLRAIGGAGCLLVAFWLLPLAASQEPAPQYVNFFDVGAYNVAVAPQPTNTPQQVILPPQWHTLLDVSGDGSKKTVPLTVPSEWRIQWACDPTSNYFGDYNVIVSVYTTDGVPLDIASVNSMCKKNSTTGETEEYGAGQVYLDIRSEGAWTLHITGLS